MKLTRVQLSRPLFSSIVLPAPQPARRRLVLAAMLAAAFFAGAALAQGGATPHGTPATPAATVGTAGYAGPTTVPLMTVKALLATGKDDQNAVLRGRLVSHDGGEHYTFDDDTGRMRVEIDAALFPTNRLLDDKVTVELVGELDRKLNAVEFEVEQIRMP